MLATVVLLLGACATPVGVRHADPRQVHRELTESALTGDRPNAPTQEFLTRMNLRDRFRTDPDATLAVLHEGLASGRRAEVELASALPFPSLA